MSPPLTPPFPFGLSPRPARRQAVLLLAIFYAVVYGSEWLLGGRIPQSILWLVLSTFALGAFMLAMTAMLAKSDVAWRQSLGLEPLSWRAVAGWSVVGFLAAYLLNLAVSLEYMALGGNLEAQAARRVSWIGVLAKLPVATIVPLATFVAVWEEVVFRGFLLGRLRASIPTRNETEAAPGARLRRDLPAIALSALFFGAGHGYQGPLGLIQTTVAGLVLGSLAVWRASLWPCIGTHLAIDAFGLAAIKLFGSMVTK